MMTRRPLAILVLLGVAAAAPAAVGAGVAKTVKVRDDFFKPTSVTVSKGQTVKWSWGDGTKHRHTVTAANGKWTSKEKKTGTYKHTFKKTGTFTVLCVVHPKKMVMEVKVKK
jgi:plastocyanin